MAEQPTLPGEVLMGGLPLKLRHSKRPVARISAACVLAMAATWALVAPVPTQALTLGRLQVASVLGEPLRAEIEVRDLSEAEASTLRANLAAPGVYRAAGIEYAGVLRSARVDVARRPDGRTVLRVVSDQPALDPFVDVILQLEWANGRMVREYTLLLDPPRPALALSQAPAPAPTLPPAPPPAAEPAPVAPAVQSPTAVAAAPEASPPASAPATTAVEAPSVGAPPVEAPALPPVVAPPVLPEPPAVAAPAASLTAPPAPPAAPAPAPEAAPPPTATPASQGPASAPRPTAAPAPRASKADGAVSRPRVPSKQAVAASTDKAAKPPAAPARAAAPALAPAPAAAIAAPGTATPRTVTVEPGQTLFRIAMENRPQGISLDRMLIGLYQANPQAFLDGNMNRLKAGSVLKLPGTQELAGIDGAQARQQIQAQSADFDAYRRRLAALAPKAAKVPTRRATGQVQAQVRDAKAPEQAPPDRLTLTQGRVANAAESAVSGQTEARALADRQAELARNLAELRRLQDSALGRPAGAAAARAGSSTAGAAVSPPPGGPTLPVPAPAGAAAAAQGDAASAAAARDPAREATLVAAAPVSPPPPPAAPDGARAPSADSTAAATPAAKPGAPPPADAEDAAARPAKDDATALADDPLVVPAAIGLIVVLLALAVFALVRARRRARQALAGDNQDPLFAPTTYLAGDAEADAARAVAPASEAEALDQLGAMGDVDPVAEADVYLAYGRDRQAEEILLEGMRAMPHRLDIPAKLLEIHALRRDPDAFESLARRVHEVTGGVDDPWPRIAEMGRAVDPDNPLYGGIPSAMPAEAASDVPFDDDLAAQARAHDEALPDLGDPPPTTTPPAGFPDDFQADPLDAPRSELPAAIDLGPEPAPAEARDFTLDVDARDDESAARKERSDWVDAAADAKAAMPDLSDAAAPEATPDLSDTAEAADAGEPADAASVADVAPPPPPADHPLARKLALAEEFARIGDLEAARDLLTEVTLGRDPELKARAEALLDELG
jgi:pilus assembly protein FimV